MWLCLYETTNVINSKNVIKSIQNLNIYGNKIATTLNYGGSGFKLVKQKTNKS